MDQQKKDKDVFKQKDIAYYSAMLNGWIQNRMERDRSLITLSAGGIGLLITLLSTVGIKNNSELTLYSVALFFFLVTLGLVLTIYKRNSTYIEKALKKITERDPVLSKLDLFSSITFGLAVIFSISIGILNGITLINKTSGDNIMNKQKNIHKMIDNEKGVIKKSVNGITNLSPEAITDSSGSSTSDSQTNQSTNTSSNESQTNSSQSDSSDSSSSKE